MGKTATVRQLQVAALFMQGGWMPSGASAMTGNLSQESGPNLPSAFRHGKLDHGSQGLPQWRLGRLTAYMDFVRRKHPEIHEIGEDEFWVQYGRLDYQCEYIMIEVARDYPRLDAILRKGGSVSAITADICWQFERPSKTYANLANRIENALLVFNSLPDGAHDARKTNIVAALDARADDHDAQKNTALVATASAAGLGLAVPVIHTAPDLHWYEWTVLGLVAFVIVACVMAAIAHANAARLVRNAKPNVDAEAEPKQPAPSAAPAEPEPEPEPVSATDKAKRDEQAAIDAALSRTKRATAAIRPTQPAKASIKSEATGLDQPRPDVGLQMGVVKQEQQK